MNVYTLNDGDAVPIIMVVAANNSKEALAIAKKRHARVVFGVHLLPTASSTKEGVLWSSNDD